MDAKSRWIVVDPGCAECGHGDSLLGIYGTEAEAQEVRSGAWCGFPMEEYGGKCSRVLVYEID